MDRSVSLESVFPLLNKSVERCRFVLTLFPIGDIVLTEVKDMLTHSIVNRVISEVAGTIATIATIATNGIQELSAEERGGISTRGYVCVCLKSTAYNAVRSMHGFDMSYGEFCRYVDAAVDQALTR